VEATNGFTYASAPEEGINPAARFIEERLEITSSSGADVRSNINAAYGREQHMTELQASRGGNAFYMKLK
jgi:hypothetical protein